MYAIIVSSLTNQGIKMSKRVHISLNVFDLEKSKDFYSRMLNNQPTFEKEGYVQWKLNDPSINLVIESSLAMPFGLSHFGMEINDAESLKSIYSNVKDGGFPSTTLDDTQCCYANSEKAWFLDPSNIRWETFLTYSRSDEYGDATQGELTQDA